jgi:hypothetical protein
VENGERSTEGKEPISFEFYHFVAAKMLASGDKEIIFAHAMFNIAWNLMCRISNTIGICYGHLAWVSDSLECYFAIQKNDQTGDRSKFPRHIYANPINPAIWPILSLAVYFAVFGFNNANQRIFPVMHKMIVS